MLVCVVGSGAVGFETVAQLVQTPGVDVLVADRDQRKAHRLAHRVGHGVKAFEWNKRSRFPRNTDVVVSALAPVPDRRLWHRVLEAGLPYVTVADDPEESAHYWDMRNRIDIPVVVGAGMAPGFADVLARHGASLFDSVEEVSVFRAGFGGGSCESTARRISGQRPLEARAGRVGSVGRVRTNAIRQMWFPAPVGPRDCKAVGLGIEGLSHMLPEAKRVVAYLEEVGNKKPPIKLRPANPNAWGGVVVEVWGTIGERLEVACYGAVAPVAKATGIVASVAALRLGQRDGADRGVMTFGEVDQPEELLSLCGARGLKPLAFDGLKSYAAG